MKTHLSISIGAFVSVAFALPALGANLLLNPGFDISGPNGSFVVSTGYRGVGPSAAANWNVFHNTEGTTTTEIVESTLPGGGKMITVATSGGSNGIAQVWGPMGTGPACVNEGVWIFVVSGQAYIGAGNQGNTGPDAYTTTTGAWEFLPANNSFCPANAFIIYAANGPAEFHVDFASVEPQSCLGPPGDLDMDGDVDGADLGLLLAAWGPCDCEADIDDNGVVDGADFGFLLANWGC